MPIEDIKHYVKHFNRIPAPAAQKQWVQVYDTVTVHSQGKSPKAIIDKKRPYEDEQIKEYRVDAWEPITQGTIRRAMNSLTRLFGHANVSFNISQALEEYLNENNFSGVNLNTYIVRTVVPRMIEDPNGLLVWYPKDSLKRDQTQEALISPMLVLSKNIIDYPDDSRDALTFLADEKSEVTRKDNDKEVTVKEGKVYYIIDDTWFYKWQQYGEKSKDKFELIEYYKHDLGYIPYVKLGGVLVTKDAENNLASDEEVEFFESYFSPFVAFANEAIRQFSDHQGIMVTCAFPIREMERMPCTNSDCRKGYVRDENNAKSTCGVCEGEGFIMPTSPFGVIFRESRTTLSSEKSASPALIYHTPDVAIIEYSGKYWRDLLHEGEKALSMVFTDHAQSGKAKEIDRKEQDAAIDAVGINVFMNIFMNSIKLISKLRGFPESDNISVNVPASFREKDEIELSQELANLKEKKAPSFLISEKTRELVRRQFSGDPLKLRAVDILIAYDPLFPYDESEISLMVASSTISNDAHTRHILAYPAIMELATQDSAAFLQMEFSEALKKLDEFVSRQIVDRSLRDGNGNPE